MTPPTLDQIIAALGGRRTGRRRRLSRARPAELQSLPNEWTTAAGDHAQTYRARTTPGHPQRYGWRVIAPNGQTIASSGETFTRRRSARRAMARVFPPAGGAS